MHPPADRVEALLAQLRRGRQRSEPGMPDGAEPLDQLAHALQCAHELATAAPDDPELQVAGLVHDIGHLLAPGDDAGHGRIGGEHVRGLLGDRVARLVELHVPAKRYLVATDDGYGQALSAVSTVTLARQGGAMTCDEVRAFAALGDCADAVRLRRADEAAKVPGRVVPGLDTWRPVLLAVASRHRREGT